MFYRRQSIRLHLLLGLSFLAVLLTAAPARAIPTLQLDIQGGVYDWTTETVVAQSDPFLLYAYLIPDKSNTLSDQYYISAALAPQAGPMGSNLGSFSVNGTPVSATADMHYGVPPLEAMVAFDPGDLPQHGIYETYFAEFAFQFPAANTATAYNTQLSPGSGPTPDPAGTMYYYAFTIDTTLLASDYVVHFDLYNTAAAKKDPNDIDVRNNFAPFSHDAESRKVPEPATLLLLGLGLVGLKLYGARRQR